MAGSLFAGATVQEGINKMPYLVAGKHRLLITKTVFQAYTQSIVVEFTHEASSVPDVVGTPAGRVFPTNAATPQQKQMKLEEWTRFIVAAMGYRSLAELQAAGHNVLQLAEACSMPAGVPGAQPVTGRRIDVDATPSGRLTKANPAKQYAGGDVILNFFWSPVG
jgi:hypothetical protein